jgi:hypothetical protein
MSFVNLSYYPLLPKNYLKIYLDSSTHQAITGAHVEISDKKGSEFKAFNGALTGTILKVIW